MSQLALSASFEYLYYGSTSIINIVIPTLRGSTLDVRTDVYRRQILTSKVDHRAGRVNTKMTKCRHIHLPNISDVDVVVDLNSVRTRNGRKSVFTFLQHVANHNFNTIKIEQHSRHKTLYQMRRWTNVKTTLIQRFVRAGNYVILS